MNQVIFYMMPIAGAMLLAFGLFQVIMDMRSSKQRKILGRLTEGRPYDRQRKQAENLLRQRAGDSHRNALEAIVSKLRFARQLQHLLDQADVNWSASRMLVNLTAAAAAVMALLFLLQYGTVTCLATGAGIFLVPVFYLIHRRRRRIKRLVGQLPEVFDMMGQSLRAGHSLAGAIQMVSQQMPNPVANEFGRVFHEQNLGIKVEDALMNMAKRLDQMDVRFFVTAVLIQRQVGGDLAEVLDKIAKVIRGRVELFGVVSALTAEGRLSGWVLLLLPVAVFIALQFLNPDYAAMLTDTESGRLLLGVAIIMDLMGLAMIKKIVNIKV